MFLLAFGSTLFTGLTAALSKIGVRDMGLGAATAIRTGVVLLLSWIMVFLTGSIETIGLVSVRTCLFLVLSGLATEASWLPYSQALYLGDVNKVVPIDKFSTIITMILVAVILGEELGAMKFFCTVLMGTGTTLMIRRTPGVTEGWGGKGWMAAAFMSAVFASLTVILGKVGIQRLLLGEKLTVKSAAGLALMTAGTLFLLI